MAKLLALFFGFLLFGLPGAQISDLQAVYLLPMAHGLDQYIANHLTKSGVFQVVTDPRLADAVFTDRLGDAFEKRLIEFYPEPTATPAPPVKEEKKDSTESAESSKKKEEKMVRVSSLGGGKGNVFLVTSKSRRVVWSVYERPKNSYPEELDRAANRIVRQLKKDLSGK